MTMHLRMIDCGGHLDAEARKQHEREQVVFQRLLESHDAIRRELEFIEGGTRTVTTATDPELAVLLRVHVPELHRRLRESAHLRDRDPLYRTLFEQRGRIEVHVEERPDGVVVDEVSEDPGLAHKLREHATQVNTFVLAARELARQYPPVMADDAVSERVGRVA
ncbi:hypothetical protein [Thioalkalivibrio sp. ALE23]|uniref:hypothetical protein n=1 Tax=Thioalkalivibrio sp. ALE23 TaxID=1265495 RepID=UPI00036EA897|nr:hypothetical protein [Thioalkalivibrio sp. ALE23]